MFETRHATRVTSKEAKPASQPATRGEDGTIQIR